MFQNALTAQKNKLERAQRIEIKNIKRVFMQESIDFVKRSSENIQRVLTKEHQGLLKQFIEFKKSTWGEIEFIRDCAERMLVAE